MSYQSVGEIFDGNAKVRERFRSIVGSLTGEQAAHVPKGEKWSIAQIVEHVSMVEDGMSRICIKLLGRAEADGIESNGVFEISTDFFSKSGEAAHVKLEAPERVHPNEGKSISESLTKMDEASERFAQQRPSFEKYDCRAHKFPHPYFGDLTAVEWLVLIGGHEARHLQQIKKIIEQGFPV